MKKSSFIIDPLMQLPGIKPERLMQLSLPTLRTDVNMPDNSGYILIRSDAWPLMISSLFVKVDTLYIKSSNLLIIRAFCQYFVDKKFELRSGVSDMIRQPAYRRASFADLAGCLFYLARRLAGYNPHKPPLPLNSPTHGGRRPPKKTAVRNLKILK